MRTTPDGYRDLGWANSWRETPEEVKRCREQGHRTTDIDKGRPPHRGLDHVVTCDVCRIVYHYDSSD